MNRRLALLVVNAVALTIATLICTFRIVLFSGYLDATRDGTPNHPGPWVDWQTYAAAFERLVHGQSIYAPAQLAGPYQLTHMVLIGYAYPPPSVPLFAPFASYPLGLAAWLTLNLWILFAALWALSSRAWPRHRMLLFAGLVAGLSQFEPFVDGVISANVNVAIAGGVGWIVIGASPAWLGIAGAGGALTKIFPGVLAAAGQVDKGRSIAIALGVAGAVCLLTLPLVGMSAWTDFVHALTGAVPDCYQGNWSIACALHSSAGIPAGTVVGLAIGGAAGLSLLIVRHPFWLAVLASVAMLAPVTNLHPHHWIVAPVLLVGVIATWREARSARLALVPS